MAAHFTAERWRAYHEREKAYYRNPMIQWFSAGEMIATASPNEPGYYVLHSCGEPGCCLPAGPFATPEQALEYSRVQLMAKEEERAQRREASSLNGRWTATADLYLYPTEQNGRKSAARGSYRPIGFLRKDPTFGLNGDQAYGIFFELGDTFVAPGETKRVNCFFIYGPSFDVFINAKKFYIWDGRIVGEATLVDSETQTETLPALTAPAAPRWQTVWLPPPRGTKPSPC